MARARQDKVASLLTAASGLLAELPDRVVQDRRAALVKTLGQARELVIEVHCKKPAVILIRDGDQGLMKLSPRVP
jgi:hypothetical protein